MLFSQQQLVNSGGGSAPHNFCRLNNAIEKEKKRTDHTVSAYTNIPLKGSKTDLEKETLFFTV